MNSHDPAHFANTLSDLSCIADRSYASRNDRAIWLQIYDRLLDACHRRVLDPGTKLPGEILLAETFKVSRVTMRRALSRLQQEGHLQSRKGVGIFVRPRPARYRVDAASRFADRLLADGRNVLTRTLSLQTGVCDDATADALDLARGSFVIRLIRLRLLDDVPIYYTKKHFPADAFPRFREAYEPRQSVSDVFSAHGMAARMKRETRVTGCFAGREEAEALQLTQQIPLLRMYSVTYGADARVVELNNGVWPLTGAELVFRN